jgi:hypothetical protein
MRYWGHVGEAARQLSWLCGPRMSTVPARNLRPQGPGAQSPHNTGNNNRNALPRDPDGNLVEIVAKVT